MNVKKILSNRRFRYGGFATIFSAAFLAGVVLINVIATVVAEKFPLDIDLTSDSVFMLTDETIDYVKNLEEKVEIVVLADEASWTSAGSYYAQAIEVINRYAQYSNNLSVTYVDLVKNPNYTANYPDLELSPNNILVKSDRRSKVISSSDLFNIQTSQYYGSYIASSKAEQTMTSAIMYVANEEVVTVSVLTGHNEYEPTALIRLLEQNNYQVKTQNLVTEEIDPEASLAIIVAPQRDFEEDNLKKLDKYLSNDEKLGKNLIYFADATQPTLPNLEAFLKEWGIEVQSGAVAQTDTSQVLYNNYYFSLVDYVNEDVAGTLLNRNMRPALPVARPLAAVFTAKNGFTTEVLLQFNEGAGVRPDDAGENFVPSASIASGPIPGMMLSSKIAYANNERLISRVAVCGSMYAIDSSLLQSTSVTNSEYFMNLINQMSERRDVISITPKTIGGSELNITLAQVNTIAITFIIVLPAVIVIFGLVIWLRRRHR